MKLEQSPNSGMLRNLMIAFLLVVAGAFGQYRYHVVEKIVAKDGPEVSRQSELSNKLFNTDKPSQRNDVDFAIFWEVWDLLEKNYLDAGEIDSTQLVDGAVSGMTAAVGDPYTMYLPPKAFERSGEDLAGAFYGVGIELGYKEGVLAVVAPIKNGPAQRAGIQAGDLIIRVVDEAKDLDEDSTTWSLSHAVDQIRGPKGSKVTLTLVREGEPKPLEITISRDEIVIVSVELEMIEHDGKKIAHIMLSKFGERTKTEWSQVVNEIVKARPELDGIVLDMRNNPGGLFNDAIDIASDFIQEGVVVSQQGKYSKQDFKVTGKARLINIPLEVLVNKGSASASEIVAGALRDRINAKLIGEQTFGKGTVQDRLDTSNGGGVHITVARWLLPSGGWIHDEGLPVEVEVKDDPQTDQDEALLRAIEEL